MTINERLKAVRLELNLSQKALSGAIGVKQSYYSEVENGKRKVTAKIINSLLVNYNISSDWLISGKGLQNISKSDISMTCFDDVFDGGLIKAPIEVDEISLVSEIETNKRKVVRLYNRIIDVRVLLHQLLDIKNNYATDQEAEILNRLTRPVPFTGSDGKEYSGVYENLNINGKFQYNERLKKCISLFTTVFFENFRVLYRGLQKNRPKN